MKHPLVLHYFAFLKHFSFKKSAANTPTVQILNKSDVAVWIAGFSDETKFAYLKRTSNLQVKEQRRRAWQHQSKRRQQYNMGKCMQKLVP